VNDHEKRKRTTTTNSDDDGRRCSSSFPFSLSTPTTTSFPPQPTNQPTNQHRTFYQSTDLTLWFSGWKTGGQPALYAAALLGLFSLAAAQEGLAAARSALARPPPCCRCGEKRDARSNSSSSSNAENGSRGLEAPLLPGAGGGEAPAAASAAAAAAVPIRPCCAAQAAAASSAAPSSSSSPPSPRKPQAHNPACLLRASLSTLFTSRPGSALLYAVHAAASYLLMLAAMTYNLGACAAVLCGLAAGHVAARRGAGAPLADACHAPRLEGARTLPSGALP